MSDRKTLFEKQYTQGKLEYKVLFPGLRKLLKSHLNDRYDVTTRLLEKVQGKRILDFGCGDGKLIFRIHKQFSDCYGLDIVSSHIEAANNFVETNLGDNETSFHFVENEADKPIPFPDKYFDVVMSIAVIYSVSDLYSLGKEFHRVLKDEGILVVECPNFAYIKNRFYLMFGKLPTSTATEISFWPEIGWDGGCLHYFTKKTLISFLEQCGFTIERVKSTGLLIKIFKVFSSFFATGFVLRVKKAEGNIGE